MVVSQSMVEEVLDTVLDPCSVSAGVPLSIREMGLVRDLQIDDDGTIQVTLRLTSPGCIEGVIKFTHEIERGVGALPGVRKVEVNFFEAIDWSESDISQSGRKKLEIGRRLRRHTPVE